MLVVFESFGLEMWHTYYQHTKCIMKKNYAPKNKNAILGRVLKLAE